VLYKENRLSADAIGQSADGQTGALLKRVHQANHVRSGVFVVKCTTFCAGKELEGPLTPTGAASGTVLRRRQSSTSLPRDCEGQVFPLQNATRPDGARGARVRNQVVAHTQ
jgi:hypothetical protein